MMTNRVEVTQAEEIGCATCEGRGWVLGVGTDYEDQCCGGSNWECGARGCTGPIAVPVPIQVQEQCGDCEGMA